MLLAYTDRCTRASARPSKAQPFRQRNNATLFDADAKQTLSAATLTPAGVETWRTLEADSVWTQHPYSATKINA
jgi:hypothetical protein